MAKSQKLEVPSNVLSPPLHNPVKYRATLFAACDSCWEIKQNTGAV
jgi:hypothetical protein